MPAKPSNGLRSVVAANQEIARRLEVDSDTVRRFGIGKDAVARVWADHNLKPWRVDTFKLSTDPDFEESSSTSLDCI